MKGIDYFRVIAALFIVAVHTGPFAGIHAGLDYEFTYCAGRIGVPFFLAVTGYFTLSSYLEPDYLGNVKKTVKKLGAIYLYAIVLYLPLNWYAGGIPHTADSAIKDILFDGTFYHLWYLPAVMLGCILVAALLHYSRPWVTGSLVLFLYLLGVLGDSWYGLISHNFLFRNVYDVIFSISTYTRNGIFFAPVFLWMGAMLSKYKIERKNWQIWFGFAISLFCMLLEGGITRHLDWQRHNSMYLFLLPTVLFLFEGLKRVNGNAPRGLRDLTMLVYLLHPYCIVIIRGAAGILKQEQLMVEHTILFFMEVSLLSITMAAAVHIGKNVIRCKIAVRKKARYALGMEHSRINCSEGDEKNDGNKKQGMDRTGQE